MGKPGRTDQLRDRPKEKEGNHVFRIQPRDLNRHQADLGVKRHEKADGRNGFDVRLVDGISYLAE